MSANKGLIGIRIMALFFIVFLAPAQVFSFTTNGTQKTFDFAVTSAKNAEISSSNFRTYSVIGDIAAVVNSSNFKTELGFLRTLPYLDGEPCQVNSECVGNFCCSNVCKSSACPTEEAAPSAAGAAAAAGGGGGGEIIESFTIDKEFIKALITQGDTYKTKFTIKNTGTEELLFDIDYSDLKEFLLLSDTKFALLPDNTKEIDVTIFASEKQKPDVYTGNIRIKGNSIEKALPVIIEVRAKEALFDIKVEVMPQYKNVLKTENVVANITLINVGDLKPVDVQLYYAIRDIEGNDLIFGVETLAIYNEISRIKELELPPNISLGTYLFYAKVSYGTETAAAVDIFYVVSEKPVSCLDGIKNQNEEGIDCGGICAPCKFNIFKYLLLILGITILMIIVIIIIMILVYIIKRKKDKEKTKEEEILYRLMGFVNLALRRGYSIGQLRILLLKKYPEEIVDSIFDKLLSDRVKNEIKARQAARLNRELMNYINRALSLGYKASDIRKELLKAGWSEKKIEEHMSEAIRSKFRL